MILDGKKCSSFIKDEILEKVKELKYKPCLVAIQVGDDKASNIYLGRKEKLAKELGIDFWLVKYTSDVSQEELLSKIEELNNDDKVTAMMIQLPLPKHLNEDVLVSAIDPRKDADGLNPINQGKTLAGASDAINSCTALGIIKMLEYYKVDLTGKKVTIIGRSKLVGKPLIGLFLKANASVSILHSKSLDLNSYTKNSDIIVVAVGKARFLTKEMISNDQIIIDVGMNRLDDRLCGDVCFDDIVDDVKMITPVPGGVGPMTVVMLMYNVLKCAKIQEEA